MPEELTLRCCFRVVRVVRGLSQLRFRGSWFPTARQPVRRWELSRTGAPGIARHEAGAALPVEQWAALRGRWPDTTFGGAKFRPRPVRGWSAGGYRLPIRMRVQDAATSRRNYRGGQGARKEPVPTGAVTDEPRRPPRKHPANQPQCERTVEYDAGTRCRERPERICALPPGARR